MSLTFYFHKNRHKFATEKVLATHEIFFVLSNMFLMVHFMAKRSNFDYLLAILMNITPKPVMLKNSFFVISVTMPKKKVKFYIDIS